MDSLLTRTFFVNFAYCILFISIIELMYIGLRTQADTRYFIDIVKQCESQGYIQDTTTRIVCSVEKSDLKNKSK